MSVQFLGGTRTGAGGQPLPFSPAVKAGPFVFVSRVVPASVTPVLAPPNVRGALVSEPNGLSGLFLFCDITNFSFWFKFVDDFDEKPHFKLVTNEQTLCRYHLLRRRALLTG